MSNIKVLYISYDGMTDPLGQSQVIPYITGLSQAGYDITLISCEKPENFKLRAELIASQLKSSAINWIPLKYTKRPPLFSTLWDIFRIYKTARREYRKNKFQIIHCRSYIPSLIGLKFKRNFGVKFIFDMRGLWADERVDGNLWDLKNPIYRLIYNYFKGKERSFLADSDATISLTVAGKQEMESWAVFKESRTKIYVIPCSADFNLFKNPGSEQRKISREQFNIPKDAFVLTYLGSLGTWYMLDEMLDVFKALLRKNDNSIFLILTPDNPEVVYSKALEKGIDGSKLIIQFSSRTELVNKMCVSDVSIFFVKKCYSKIASSPTKLGELLAMEIPVISNSGIGDMNSIIKATGGGIVIDDFNEINYDKAIDSLSILKAVNMQEVRSKAKEYYDLEKAVKTYQEVYSGLLQ